MSLSVDAIQALPKVELHVHLEGSIRPETVLALAKRNGSSLPTNSLEGLNEWYRFRDFPHFVEVYVAISKCIKNPEDIEFIATEFLDGQAKQNVLYTEVTYTASTIARHCGIPFDEQMDALRQARAKAQVNHGIDAQFIVDIVRGDTPDGAAEVASWVEQTLGNGVCALGLAGFESRGTQVYREVFDHAKAKGIPVTAHAGETEGAWSIEETLDVTGARRIGHGVRALESPSTVARLIREGVTLEVCPTSNVCLGVVPSFAEHPLPKLVEAGITVTLNSDDPPMFGTSLSEEYHRCASTFGWHYPAFLQVTHAAISAAFLPSEAKQNLRERVEAGYRRLEEYNLRA